MLLHRQQADCLDVEARFKDRASNGLESLREVSFWVNRWHPWMYLCPARKRLNTLPVGKWCTQDCQPQGRGSHVSVGPERHVASLCSEAFVSPPFFFFLMEKSSPQSRVL